MINKKRLENGSTELTINLGGDAILVLNSFGASIFSISTKSRDGELEVITMTPKGDSFFGNSKYAGTTVGPVGGRIHNASFIAGGSEYVLKANEKGNLLHSGFNAWCFDIFDYHIEENKDKYIISFYKEYKHLQDGFPGNRKVEISYICYKEIAGFDIVYHVISDMDTPLCLINHSYFNLSGNLKRNIDQQILTDNKSLFLVLDKDLIPVKKEECNGVHDFRIPLSFIERYKDKNVFDDIFTNDQPLRLTLMDPISGRKMSIHSDYESVVLYTNNYIDDTLSFIGSEKDLIHLSVAIEPTRYPCIMNKDGLIIKKDEDFLIKTEYRFSVMEEK